MLIIFTNIVYQDTIWYLLPSSATWTLKQTKGNISKFHLFCELKKTLQEIYSARFTSHGSNGLHLNKYPYQQPHSPTHCLFQRILGLPLPNYQDHGSRGFKGKPKKTAFPLTFFIFSLESRCLLEICTQHSSRGATHRCSCPPSQVSTGPVLF